MTIFVPGIGQHGLQQGYGQSSQKQFPSSQLQILQQQKHILMQEIALKKLLQQQQHHQLALLQQQQQAQQQQAQVAHLQAQAAASLQQQTSFRNFQPIGKGTSSPDLSSGTSSPITHYSNRTFDQIEDWEVPSTDLIQKIIQQVEYYFSNEYLTRDAYFLRQIRRKREGYLSMKLITNFKKVRKLVKDPRITSYCLRQSTTLQVNEDGTKVRRIAAIPEDLRRFAVSRSLLVTKIPSALSSIEALMTIFYQFGDISSVRILRPSKDIPHDLRDILGKMADNMTGISAVVEFETAGAASSAYTRFCMKSEVTIEGNNYEITVNLLGLESVMGDDDSGCGESGSSGDECSNGQDLNQYLINDTSHDLEEDYEAYMNEIRKERQTENKTHVPGFIASLMDEYGSGSTVPVTSNAVIAPPTTTTRKKPFEPFNPIGPVRTSSAKTSVWSTNWTAESSEDENDSQLQSMLAESALSAFGNLRIDDDDVFANDTDGNLIAPTQQTNAPIAAPVQRGWADAVRK